jgi:hypothetical protein
MEDGIDWDEFEMVNTRCVIWMFHNHKKQEDIARDLRICLSSVEKILGCYSTEGNPKGSMYPHSAFGAAHGLWELLTSM